MRVAPARAGATACTAIEPISVRPRESGDPGPRNSAKELGPRFRGDERNEDAIQAQPISGYASASSEKPPEGPRARGLFPIEHGPDGAQRWAGRETCRSMRAHQHSLRSIPPPGNSPAPNGQAKVAVRGAPVWRGEGAAREGALPLRAVAATAAGRHPRGHRGACRGGRGGRRCCLRLRLASLLLRGRCFLLLGSDYLFNLLRLLCLRF